jgi:hypothetical protein
VDTLKTRFEKLEKNFQERFRHLQNGIQITMFMSLQDDVYQGRVVGQKAVSYLQTMLDFAPETGNDDMITETLDRLNATLTNNVHLSAELASELGETIQRLPEEYQMDRDALRHRILNLHQG